MLKHAIEYGSSNQNWLTLVSAIVCQFQFPAKKFHDPINMIYDWNVLNCFMIEMLIMIHWSHFFISKFFVWYHKLNPWWMNIEYDVEIQAHWAQCRSVVFKFDEIGPIYQTTTRCRWCRLYIMFWIKLILNFCFWDDDDSFIFMKFWFESVFEIVFDMLWFCWFWFVNLRF